MEKEWNNSFDVVIVGSGNGGLTAALCAHEMGLKNVLVVEKSDLYGGTSSISGGGVWIPCNRYAKEAGAKRVVLLDVSAPFHSKLMKSAVHKMKDVLDGINFLDFKIPMVTNFDAKTISDKSKIKNLLLDQLISPVLWHQSIKYLNSNLGVKSFMEVGPKNVLTGLIKRIVPECETSNFGEKADLDKI